MTVDSVLEILRLLDFHHLKFLVDNFYDAEKGEQVHKRIATKFYILALCDALDRQPILKDLKGELKELKPEESEVRELDYDKYEDIDEKIKEVWSDRAEELRSNIGIYSDWKYQK